MASVWSSLSNIPDPRTGNAQRHKLLDVLTIALVASICGAESCVDFADFARDREALFREFLELPGGPPSHDTFSRVFRLLDPAAFGSCFAAFLDDLGAEGTGVLAIDGKTLRRSHDRAAGKSALHVVTAFATDARIVIGAVASGFVLYIGTKVLSDLGGAGLISPFVAAWSPAIVGVMIGALILLYQEDG